MNPAAIMLATVLLLQPAMALAGITVRSGEHAAYSRLVFPLKGKMKWRMKWLGDRYELRFFPPPGRIDLSNVFRFIPRTRLRSMQAPADLPGVVMIPAAGYHARARELLPGYLVVDFRAGPVRVRETGPLVTPGPARASMIGPPWPPLLTTSAGRGETEPGQGPAGSTTQARLGGESQKTTSRPAKVPPVDQASGETARVFFPDIRLMLARAHLLAQLRNAREEGVILPGPEGGHKADRAAGADSANSGIPQPGNSNGSVGLEARRNMSVHPVPGTQSVAVPALNPDDLARCPDDRVFRLPFDRRQGRMPVALGALRSGIVNEAGRVDPGKLENMVRFFISRRMGVEARALLDSYPGILTDASLLADMARVIEIGAGAPDGALGRYVGCPGEAGIWAIFSRPYLTATSYADGQSLLSDFAMLPAGLRHLLGAGLVGRLRKAGALRLASGIAALTQRAPGPESDEFKLEKARLDLAMNRTRQARKELSTIASGRSPIAAEAMTLFLEAGLKAGVPAPPDMLDIAAFQAFSLRFTPAGARLRRAEILQRAIAGDQGEAFDILAHETRVGAVDKQDAAEIAAGIFRSFSLERMDPAQFVKLFFRFRGLLGSAAKFDDVRRHVARALIKSGLPAVALQVLSPMSRRESPATRLIRARALIDLDSARMALDLLDGMTGPEVGKLRTQALERLGLYGRAVASEPGLTDSPALQQTAWRAGRWDIVRKGRNKLRKDAAIYAEGGPGDGMVRDGVPTFATHLKAPEKPQLAGLQGLLKASRQSRQTVENLLRQNPAP